MANAALKLELEQTLEGVKPSGAGRPIGCSICCALRLSGAGVGILEPSELKTLTDLGLKKLDLDYKRAKKTDAYGNEFRYRAKVKDAHDAQLGRWAWDVFLLRR